MSSPKTNRRPADRPPKLTEKSRSPTPDSDNTDRDRLRDIIVVFITFPITPTQRTEEVARKKPWLEVLSLVLKAALAAYAIYKGMEPGEW